MKGLTLSVQQKAVDISNGYSEDDNVSMSLLQDQEKFRWFRQHGTKQLSLLKELWVRLNLSSRDVAINKETETTSLLIVLRSTLIRWAINAPFLAELINHLEVRFATTQSRALQELRSILPASLIKSSRGRRTVVTDSEFCVNDATNVNEHSFFVEFRLVFVKRISTRPSQMDKQIEQT